MKLPLLPNGAALKLTQADGVLGGRLWPAARALCEFVSRLPDTPMSDLDCLELGAGTGAVGLYTAAALGCQVTLTERRPPRVSVMSSVPYGVDGTPEFIAGGLNDYAEPSDRLLQLLQRNVDQNVDLFVNNNVPRVMELDWNNRSHFQHVAASASKTRQGFDLILASDVTYVSRLHQALADTMASLLLRPEQPYHLISRDNHKDSNHRPFLQESSMAIPKCFVSHQERRRTLDGQDLQLAEFERALLQAGLVPVQIWSHPVADGSKMHNVSILQIQHQDSTDTSR